MKSTKHSIFLFLINNSILCLICVPILATFTDTVLTSLSASEDIHFEIIEPESLRYTYRTRMAQNFGTSFAGKSYLNINLVIVEPNHCCNSIVNKLEVINNIGLIQRGGCSFLTKCIIAEQNGMKGVVIYDNNDNNDEMYIEMVSDSPSRNCSIPATFLLGRDGHMIRRALEALRLNRAVVNIPINISQITIKKRQPPWVVW